MTLITNNFESHADKLLSEMPLAKKQQLVTEIRDSIEIVHTSEYGNFLRHLFPSFHKLLSEGQPQFSEGPEQKIRNLLLEVLNRLPNNDTLRPHVQRMLSLCMKLLETDNEENAVICLRIIFDLHKNFRPTLESEVQPFLDFVQRIYQGLPKTVQLVFEGRSLTQARAQAASQAQANLQTQQQQAQQAQHAAQTAQQRVVQVAAQIQQASQVLAQAQAQHAKTPTVQTQEAVRQAATAVQGLKQQQAQLHGQAQSLAQAATHARAQAQAAGQLVQQTAAQLAASNAEGGASADGGAAADAGAAVNSGVITRSTESFKVLTECPLIVMLLFQLYPRYIQTTIPNLIPLMVQTLSLRSSAGRLAPRNKAAATDFLAAQVKTLSFLTYLLRAFADFMRPFQESIPKCVIQLLLTCPPDSVATRKDILVATRHILATDFRVGFFSQIDVLLDDSVLVGAGGAALRASHETLRPLACSTLADLIHYVRGDLSIKQLSRVVYIFSCNIHDSSLPLSIQTTSVRLLLNLVESIFHKNDPEARELLVRILHCLVYKFKTIKEAIPKIAAAAHAAHAAAIAAAAATAAAAAATTAAASSATATADTAKASAAATAGTADFSAAPSAATAAGTTAIAAASTTAAPAAASTSAATSATTTASKPGEASGDKSPADTVKEVKQMLKTMTLGVKTVVWSVSNSRMSTEVAAPNAQAHKGMSEVECRLVARLIKSGLHCFAIHHATPEPVPHEEKEVLDYFAGIFTVLDARNFTSVFQLQMPFLYERVLATPAVSTVLQHFLANSNVSRYFADILLTFLVGRMDELGATDEPQAAMLLRLFKLVFGSITLFPENEPVLRPHLATIVTSAMRYASSQPQPMNYFALLRALFKSIGGGKFEQLYKEFLPLLPRLLHSVIRCYACAQQQALKELLLELCLTLPARLSALLPYLNLLMRPVLHALRSSSEQVSMALRSLEFWIDHLHPDFLQPLMAPVLRELVIALCKQLKPHPYPFGTSALRILGKLGGRNRLFLHHSEPFETHEASSPTLTIEMRPPVEPGAGLSELEAGPKPPLVISLDAAVARAVHILRDALAFPDKKTLAADAFSLLRFGLARLMAPLAGAGAGAAAANGFSAATVAAAAAAASAHVAAQPPPDPTSAEESTDASAGAGADTEKVKTETSTTAPVAATSADVHASNDTSADAPTETPMDIEPAADLATVMVKSAPPPLVWPVTEAAAPASSKASIGKTPGQQRQEEALVVEMLMGVLLAAAVPALKAEAAAFMHHLMRHAALLFVTSPLKPPLSSHAARQHVHPRVFVSALASALRGESAVGVTEIASSALRTLVETAELFVESADAADVLFSLITAELCRVSYAHQRRSPVSGALHLEVVFSRREVPWVLSRETLVASALLKLCSDGAIECHPATAAEALASLLKLLRRCHATPLPPPHDAAQSAAFEKLVSRFAGGLSNVNAGVRDASKRALEEMAALSSQTLGDVLRPVRDAAVLPLMAGQLRSLPLTTQVANLEAVALCLRQTLADGTPLMAIDEALLRLLHEALSAVEADEAQRERRPKLIGLHVRGLAVDVRVRVVSIETLSAAIALEPLKSQAHLELRNRIIACFFRSVTLRAEEVVSVARDALAAVISQQKLQKDLLQSSLRPILLNLADYRKLSVPLLHGLSRLLSLLSNFFNLTLGEKLLEHLRRWTDPDALSKTKTFKPGDEVKIPSAILALFHLLPPAPDKFLNALVSMTMDLETNMPGSSSMGRYWSPFRAALVPYLARHAAESVTYFLKRVSDPRFFRMLLSVVKCDEGAPVREQLAAQSPLLTASTFDVSGAAAATLRFHGVVLVQAMVKRMPAWLPAHPEVLAKLMELWRSPERRARLTADAQAKMPVEQIKESKLLVKCFISYCRTQAEREETADGAEDISQAKHVELLFMMLSVFSEYALVNYDFLKDFYSDEVADKFSFAQRGACIRYFMRFFEMQSTPQEDKVHALQQLLLPMLTKSFARGEARHVLPQETITAIINKLIGGDIPAYKEALRIELLKMATLLIEHVPTQLVEHRKELIKFSWNHLKSEDTQSKQCAYVNVCRFIQVYDTPPKIILQVYVALLRTFQPDARALVKQALDILTPALPQRLPAGDHRYPTWIKWTKKIIVEEGHSLPQLIHIWQLVVRHPNLFFSSAAQFVPQMVNSLNRIGLSPNCSNENRKLAVDLAQLIISWELKRHELQRQAKQAEAAAGLQTQATATSDASTSVEAGRKRPAPDSEGSAPLKTAKVETATGVTAVPTPTPPADASVDAKADAKAEVPAAAPASTSTEEASAPAATAEGSAPSTAEAAPAAATAAAAASAPAAVIADAAAKPAPAPAQAAPSAAVPTSAAAAANAAVVAKAMASPTSSASATSLSMLDDDFKPSAAIVEVLINFLIRVALIAGDSKEPTGPALSERCVTLLTSGLTVWPEANIKYTFFEKQLAQPAPDKAGAASAEPPSGLLIGLSILRAILSKQPMFLLRNLKQLYNLLRPAFQLHIESQKMVTALCGFLSEALAALSSIAATGGAPVVAEVSAFQHWLSEIISSGLVSSKELQVYGSLMLLQVLGAHARDAVDGHLPALGKMLQRLLKEMVSRRDAAATAAPSTVGAASQTSTQAEADGTILKCIGLAIQIGAPRLEMSGETRKLYLSAMFTLIEKTDDAELLLLIVKVISAWVRAPPATPPSLSLKERVTFILKMATHFEQLPLPELHSAFLHTVLRLFSEAKEERSELLKKIEPAFMLGLRSRDAALRLSFFNLLNKRIGHAISHRLTFIISQQEWDSLSGTLWLRQATQLLLAAVDSEAALALPSSAPQLPPLRLVPLELAAHTVTASTVSAAPPAASAAAPSVSPKVASMLAAHAVFLGEWSKSNTIGGLMAPLVELLHDSSSSAFATELWVSIFPQMWNQLSATEQHKCVKPLINLLAKSYHLKQHAHNPNVIQGWLQAICACKPLPKIPAGLLKHLAKHYNAWHLAIPLLVHFAESYPEETQWYDALSELYGLLGDRDSNFAVWNRRAVHDETKYALSLEQFGSWHAAQAAYAECMNRWQAGQMALVNTPKAELSLWEEGIVRSAKALNQWELLSDYAKAWPLAQPSLLMECAWKSADWERLRSIFYSKHSLLPQSSVKMLQTYAAIHDGKLQEAEARCSEGIQSALVHWNSLPTVDVASHTPLLQTFQQFQELQESAQMLMELNNALRNGTMPELASILLTWRERLPNVWEELPAWNDLVSWRNHMFSHINNVLARVADANNSSLPSLGYQQMLWTIVRFAHVARRQQLPEACVSIIAKIQSVNTGSGPHSDLGNSFAKLREQARSCLQMPSYLAHGLHALQSADISYLPARKKAEVFQLKGELMLATAAAAAADGSAGDREAMHEGAKLISTAIQMHSDMPKAWLLWGEFCDSMHRDDYGAEPQWAERALSCYMMCSQLRHNRSASMLPRVLALLDEAEGEPTASALAQTFGRLCDGMAIWQWLPWLPQLLQGLGKYYGPYVQFLLFRMAKEYPQALYYPLRDFVSDAASARGEPPRVWMPASRQGPGAAGPAGAIKAEGAAQPAAAPAAAAGGGPSAAGAGASALPAASAPGAAGAAGDVEMKSADARPTTDGAKQGGAVSKTRGFASRVVAALASEHPQLYSQLSVVFDSVQSELKPTVLEHFLATICELSAICLSVPPSPPDALPQEVPTMLQAIDAAFSMSAGLSDDAAEGLAALHASHRQQFLKDFISEPPSVLSELISKLHGWRERLEAEMEPPLQRQVMPSLDGRCAHLVFAQQPLVEVPGQYSDDHEPMVESHVLLERFSADVLVRRDAATGVTRRTFDVLGDDGAWRCFHLTADSCLSPRMSLGLERTAQLLRLLNRRLLKSREARRRGLYLFTTPMVRLGKGVAMHVSDKSNLSLASMLIAARVDSGDAPHGTVLTHQRTLSRGVLPTLDDEARRERLRQAYNDACRTVPDDILAKAIQGHLPKAVQRWDMHRQLTAQLGLHSLLCYTIGLRAQQPQSLVLSLSTGNLRLVDLDPVPLPSTEGNPRTAYGVPFRLTRNLQRVATPFGISGTFSAVFAAAAECLANTQKCPLAMWLDYLAMPDTSGEDFHPPWTVSGEEAESRAKGVSPAELVKREGKAADVYSMLRSLIAEATNDEALQTMPPGWQAWL